MSRRTDELFVRYARWVVRRRWFVALAALGLVFTAARGGRNLGISSDYRYFFAEDDPQLVGYAQMQRVYTQDDNILFVFDPGENDAFDPQVLAAVEELTARAWKELPFATRVDSITNFQYTHAEEDDLIVADLVEDAKSKSVEELQEARKIAVSEPILLDRLVPKDARVTGVNVTLRVPSDDAVAHTKAALAARQLATSVEDKFSNVKVHLTGIVMLNNSFFEASQQDLRTLIPLMFGVLIITMFVLIRSISGTFATVLIIAFSAGSAMGLAGWLNIPITPPVSIAPTLILTLAVADSLHILVTMLQQMRRGLAKHDALIESLRVNTGPVFLTSVTTAIGFLTMNFSEVPPFNDLGNVSAMGVTIAFLLSVTLLPALVSILPVRALEVSDDKSTLMERLADWVVLRRKPLLLGSTTVVLALGALVPLNQLNDRFVQYFDDTFAFRRASDFTAENLTGIYNFEFSVGAGASGAIAEPAYLAKLDEFAAWYRLHEGVVHVSVLSDTMKRLNKNMHADEEEWHRLPDSRELAAQYLLLYEMSLPYGLDLNNQIDVDKSSTRVIVTTGNLSAADIRNLGLAGETWLQENAPKYMASTAASPALMFAHISKRNIESMLLGTFVAVLAIAAILGLALRSVRLGIVSLLPNLVPAIAAFGLWGLWKAEINLGISMVAAVSLGIVVDDTVHFLAKYQRARREENLSPENAVRYAFASVGRALVVTSFVLVTGFLILSFSPFGLNEGLGKLTATTIAIALVADLLFLPPLLMKLEGKAVAVTLKPGSSAQAAASA